MDEIIKKVKQIRILVTIGSAVASSGCILPLISFVAILVAIFAVLGIIEVDTSAGTLGAGGNCSYTVNGKNVSNIKVRLMYCDGSDPIPNQELIDFETYITGVVYQESGNNSYEALKAQAVAARSFALTRPSQMNNSGGTSLKEENGQWILSLRSCTNDQVFCHPDKGCWSKREGGQTSDSNKADWKNCTVYVGAPDSNVWSREPLPEDSQVRKAVQETQGEVLLNKNGNIVVTDYTDTNQKRWNELAKQGKDYFEILTKDYGQGNKLSTPNCTQNSSNIDSADVKNIMKLSDSEAWNQIIGKKTTENHPNISKNSIEKRLATIEVPVRVYKNKKGYETEKKLVKLTVNKALSNLYQSFFTDVYNEAPNFVFDNTLYCYNYRNATNGSRLSAHSYGVACDINSSTEGNGYGDHVYTKKEWSKLPETRSKYKILYKDSKVVEIAHKYTLTWGGEWASTTDAMHISFIGDVTRKYLKDKYLKEN